MTAFRICGISYLTRPLIELSNVFPELKEVHMARRISTSQIHSKLRQAQQKQRQAINKFNQNVRQYNQNVRQAINKYNQAVRSHNARIRANRQRLKSELARLSRQTTSTKYVVYSTSVHRLHQTYYRLEQQAETQHWDPRYNLMLDLSEREVANSLEVTNCLLGAEPESEELIVSGVD